MKRLSLLIGLVAMIWSGYWLAGWWGASTGIARWFDDRRAEGWVADYADLSVAGFPNRFDSTFTDLMLADPDTGLAWELPFFQLFALSYRPNHLIAVWPPQQTVSTPYEKLAVTTQDMRASLVLRPGTALALERTNLAVRGLSITTPIWKLGASDFGLAMHAQPDTPASYRLAMRATELAPPITFRMPRDTPLPRSFETFEADLTATFDRPWDRGAIETARPQPTALDLHRAAFVWGDLELHAAGQVQIDSLGYPTGTLTIRAVNWREIIAIARASNRVAPGVLDTIETALELAAQLAGNARELDIPLSFRNGATRIGPVPLGPAPRLVLR